MVEEYYARTSDHGYETCVEHLSMAAAFSGGFSGAFDQLEEGMLAGLFHDAGKYSEAFQKRIRDPEHVAKVDHSTAGAAKTGEQGHLYAAMAIAGHHAGLPSLGSVVDTAQDSSLQGRVKRAREHSDIINCAAMGKQFDFAPLLSIKADTTPRDIYTMMMRIRMIFSALVDGDRLDAEFFTQDNMSREEWELLHEIKDFFGAASLSEQQAPSTNKLLQAAGMVRQKLHDKAQTAIAHLASIAENRADALFSKPDKTPLDEKRCKILEQCLEEGKNPELERSIYTLTAPTGSGKTNASITFALEHAKTHGLDRVIYVIPYTSIIDQTVTAFEKEFGEEAVLPHYAEASYRLAEEDDLNQTDVHRNLASENWNASIVVTTAVQFFESLYSNKTSRCRKLHNIANSVIVFDEAQTLPPQHLKPCLKAILELVDHYRCTAVLCTATQPELLPVLRELRNEPNYEVREITTMGDDEIMQFERTTITFAGHRTLEELAEELASQPQVLCVVNTRKEAQNLYQLLKEEVVGEDGLYCLTTLHCAYDRKRLLDEIRARLAAGKPCRVVSTSLIEAGVDVDFPVAYREEAGLDSILQTAGRCNREGRRPKEESIVTVFSTDGTIPPFIRQNLDALAYVKARGFEDVNEPVAVHAYFTYLLNLRQGGGTRLRNAADPLDQANILRLHSHEGDNRRQMPFDTIDQRFHMIDSLTVPIYVPVNSEARDLCDRLMNGERNRMLFRRLGKYAVQVWPKHRETLLEAGKIVDVDSGSSDASYVLQDSQAYSSEFGLELGVSPGEGLWI